MSVSYDRYIKLKKSYLNLKHIGGGGEKNVFFFTDPEGDIKGLLGPFIEYIRQTKTDANWKDNPFWLFDTKMNEYLSLKQITEI